MSRATNPSEVSRLLRRLRRLRRLGGLVALGLGAGFPGVLAPASALPLANLAAAGGEAAIVQAIELRSDAPLPRPDEVRALVLAHALESLGLALKIAPNNPNLHFQAALVYMESGQAGQALAWLEKAVRGGYSASTVRDTPNFDPLRGNPRFQELLRGTGSNKKGDDHD